MRKLLLTALLLPMLASPALAQAPGIDVGGSYADEQSRIDAPPRRDKADEEDAEKQSDPGIDKELAFVSEILERWPDALLLLERVWAQEAEEIDGHSDTAAEVIRLLKEHVPQVHFTVNEINNGPDDIDLGRVFFNYSWLNQIRSTADADAEVERPWGHYLELQGEIFRRSLEGPGLIGFPDVDDTVHDAHVDLLIRPGYGLKLTLGVLAADNSERNFAGGKVGLSYRQEDWVTEITGKRREHWVDPLDVVPYVGARDGVSWNFSWYPKEWFTANTTLSYTELYLLEPPAGAGEEVWDGVGWEAGAALRVYCVPSIWLWYNFSWLEGDTEDEYKPLIDLQEERRTRESFKCCG